MPSGPGHPDAVPACWGGWPEVRADLRTSLWLALGLALAGVPAGLLWWWVAPRADFRITQDGPVAIGTPSQELLVADDVLFVFVLGGLGLLAGAAAWWLRRRRGVATVVALALGATAAGLVAWQVGELLGQGPSEADLTDVGARVTSSLSLGGLAALAVAPFAAVAAYLVPVLVAREDGLGREPAPEVGPPEPGPPDATGPAGALPSRHLVDAPPPGRPRA